MGGARPHAHRSAPSPLPLSRGERERGNHAWHLDLSSPLPTCHSRLPPCHSCLLYLSFLPPPSVIPASPPCHSRKFLAGIQGLFFCSVVEASQQGRASPGPSVIPHPGLGFPMNNVGNDKRDQAGMTGSEHPGPEPPHPCPSPEGRGNEGTTHGISICHPRSPPVIPASHLVIPASSTCHSCLLRLSFPPPHPVIPASF